MTTQRPGLGQKWPPNVVTWWWGRIVLLLAHDAHWPSDKRPLLLCEQGNNFTSQSSSRGFYVELEVECFLIHVCTRITTHGPSSGVGKSLPETGRLLVGLNHQSCRRQSRTRSFRGSNSTSSKLSSTNQCPILGTGLSKNKESLNLNMSSLVQIVQKDPLQLN